MTTIDLHKLYEREPHRFEFFEEKETFDINNIKSLDLSYLHLTSLPQLPNSLQELYCSHNRLENLPELPNSLQYLDCSSNKLTNLPELSNSLEELDCSNNKLTNLPELSNSLQVLYCDMNDMTNLPELPNLLENLDCSDNILINLPQSLLRTRIIYFQIRNNPIEYIPPNIQRWLKRLKQENRGIFNDSQSVHRHDIQESIRTSIERILSERCELKIEDVMNEILEDTILTTDVKRLLNEYVQNEDEIHSTLMITFKDLLPYVWNIARRNEEIKRVMNTEITDSNCMCFTGRLSRLINVLNGFDERVQIQLADNAYIGHIIAMIREHLENENRYTVEEHRRLVRIEMESRGYTEDVISEWVAFIE